jgi:hypothetical protein
LAFDLGALDAGGKTVRIIGAAFDSFAIQQHPDWVGLGLDLFDGGLTMQQVCTLAVQAMGMTNTNLVTTLYTNVAGAAPAPATLNEFVSLLQGSGGSMTQGQLLELAAYAHPNEVNIDLVGLQQTGVEFV